MMKTFGVIPSILLITLLACNTKKDEQYTHSTELITDSLILDNISLGSRINFYPSDSDLLISYVAADGQQVYFYSVAQHKTTDSLSFDKRDMDEQYYVDEDKNTYVYKTDQNTLLIRDSTGKEKNLFKQQEFLYHSWDTFTRTYSAISLPLEVIDSTMILNNLQGYHLADKRERSLYFGKEHLSHMKVTGDSIVKMNEFAAFPDFYKDNYIDENWSVATRVGKDDVYFLYSNENLLYRYHLPTMKTDTYSISNLSLNKANSYNIDRISDFSYTSEYEVAVSSYLRLLHDYKTGGFVVFQMLPIKKKKKAGMLYLYEDKPVLINVVDSNLTVYKKIYFNDHVRLNLLYAYYYDGKIFLTERSARSNNTKSSLKVYVYKTK